MKRILSLLLVLASILFAVPAYAAEKSPEFIIPPIFENAGAFTDGLSIVCINGLYGVIDEKGSFVIPPIYEYAANYFVNGALAVELNGESWLIDKTGKQITPIKYKVMDHFFIDGDLIYFSVDGEKYGFIDTTGKEIVPPAYFGVESIGFNYGLCGVKETNSSGYGFIDTTGKLVIPCQFRFAGCFGDGLAPVHDGNLWGLVDRTGKVVSGFVYDEIGWTMSEGVIAVKKGEKWAMVNTEGKELTEYKYDSLYRMEEGRMPATLGDKQGFLDYNGNVEVPFIYDGVGSYSEALAAVSKDGKYGFIDLDGKQVLDFSYDDTGTFSNGVCPVKQGEKWGMIDKQGNVVISYVYDYIISGESDLIPASIGGYWGFIHNPASGKSAPAPRVADPGITAMLPSDWARDEAKTAFMYNLVPADLRNDFEADITREEFCSVVVQFIGEVSYMRNIDAYLESKGIELDTDAFTDTSSKDVLAANALGIVNGRGDNLFDPSGKITREEAAAMLARTIDALGIAVNKGNSIDFADSAEFSPWADAAIKLISSVLDSTNERAVMGGMGDNKFEPKSNYTRQQAYITFIRLYNSIIQ